MYRLRFHGRGGKGMKTASRILGTAFFLAGFEVQDAPRYGAERRGAPIFAYVRANRRAINERGIIRRPDLVIVADETLMLIPGAGVLEGITARDNHVVAVEHSRNFGSQSAFLSGMQISTGDAVVLLDGDLQDPPEIIPQFYEKWREGFDVVYGRRVKRETKPIMRTAYKAFYKLFRGMSYVPIPLDAGDFSMIDRKVVKELLALPETDQFLRGLRAWVGFKQTGVDYTRPERMFGRTTNNWRKNIWWAKKGIFSFSFVPLELLSYFGIILTGLSFLAGIGQVIAKLLYPDIPHGITTIIVLILFFGGIQLLAMAILGEYLMKIFEETKKRPKYIRKSIRFGGKHFTTAEEMESFLNRRQR